MNYTAAQLHTTHYTAIPHTHFTAQHSTVQHTRPDALGDGGSGSGGRTARRVALRGGKLWRLWRLWRVTCAKVWGVWVLRLVVAIWLSIEHVSIAG